MASTVSLQRVKRLGNSVDKDGWELCTLKDDNTVEVWVRWDEKVIFVPSTKVFSFSGKLEDPSKTKARYSDETWWLHLQCQDKKILVLKKQVAKLKDISEENTALGMKSATEAAKILERTKKFYTNKRRVEALEEESE